MSSSRNSHCRNCGAALHGAYCHACGQKGTVGRLHLHDLLHEGWHALTHTDTGVLHLLRGLLRRPRVVYAAYFAGRRRQYFSPMVFFLVTAGLSIFVGDRVFDYEDQVNGMHNEMGRFVLEQTKFLSLLLLPVEILATWACFHRRFNLAECAVFWLFCHGLLFGVRIAAAPIMLALIRHKALIDYGVLLASYGLMLWQLLAAFGDGRARTVALSVLLVNVSMVATSLLGGYLIFDTEYFHEPLSALLRAVYLP